MRTAIYARKSTAQNAVAEDAKSVAHQVTRARQFAEQRGWTVVEEHVYVDDAASGAEFVDRELMRLVIAAKSTPRPFDVLVTMDQDRIGRDQRYTPMILHDLKDAGIQVWYYQTGEALRLDTSMDVFISGVKNFANQWHREQARNKTRDVLRKSASDGRVAGGKVLGYRNVEVLAGDKRSHVVREIDPAQADIVRRIFRMAADGKGLLRIAKTLNTEKIPNPTGQESYQDDAGRARRRPGRCWASTGVRDVLHRELYRGRVVYGKTRWMDKGKTKVRVEVPESEWLVIEQPELRIVPEPLWQAAQTRLSNTRAVYLRRTNGQLGGKPESGMESRYLLSGFLRCGVCGGNLVISKKTGQRGRPQTSYVCATRRTRGDAGCTNKHGIPATALTDAVVAQLKHVFLNPVALGKLLMKEWEDRRTSPDALVDQQRTLTRELGIIDRELDTLLKMILAEQAPVKILEAMHAREAEKKTLLAKLEQLEGLRAVAEEAFDVAAWLDETKELLENLRETLEADPAAGRQVLRHLLVGAITVTPRIEDGALFFDFAGTSSYAEYAGLAAAEAAGTDIYLGSPPIGMTSRDVTGHVSRRVQQWWPRGDSNTRHAV